MTQKSDGKTEPRNRISSVTTRTGDQGSTALADGTRLAKTSAVVGALGAVDELNSFVGLLVSELTLRVAATAAAKPNALAVDDAAALDEAAALEEAAALCRAIQQELFDLGAHIATTAQTPPPDGARVEQAVARLNAKLPPLKEFVIPGGTHAAALAHVCRTVCRRAERDLWNANGFTVGARYLNRLSDLFFVLARTLNAGGHEPQWRGLKDEPPDIG